MKLVSVSEMLSIEKEADAAGLTYDQMMENAGRGVAEEIINSYSHIGNKYIFALVGSGNNGGDALVALSCLQQDGWRTTAYLVKNRDEDDPQVERLKNYGGEIVYSEDDDDLNNFSVLVNTTGVLIDGILGTGIKLPLKKNLAEQLASYKEILKSTNNPPKIVAVDCPSGIDSDSGETAPECIPADLTITMAAVKRGLIEFPAVEYIGELRIVSIGNVSQLTSWQAVKNQVATQDMVRMLMPDRPRFSHKGTFGTALVVGGSVNYTGAVMLAGEAAYRGGAGLVTIGIPSSLHSTVAGQLPEATWLLLPDEMGVIAEGGSKIIIQNLNRVDALLLGPGFGLENTSREFIARLVGFLPEGKGELGFVRSSEPDRDQKSSLPPMVVDADGLKLLSKIEGWYKYIPKDSILTPHPGEMAIMSGLDINTIQKNRLDTASQFAKKWGHNVVLKGAYTVVAAPDERVTLIPIATSALARAGTGDVLAGLIVGLRAQGVSSYDAAVSGAWIHARAGLLAAERFSTTVSVLAGDVLRSLKEVFTELKL